MRSLFAALLFVPAFLSAQSAEVVTRFSTGNRKDIAVRVAIPHLFVEVGDVFVDKMRDGWVYGIADISFDGMTLGVEGFVAPGSDYLFRSSIGGFGKFVVSSRLTANARMVGYKNPDKSTDMMGTLGADIKLPFVTLGASAGDLQSRGMIGQFRAARESRFDKTLFYVSDSMVVPEMPWSVWVVKETGITERIYFSPSFSALVGRAWGKTAGQRYTSTTVALTLKF